MTKKPSITRKSVSLPDDIWAEIDDYRFANRISTSTEALRRLLQEALGRQAKKAARKEAK